MALLRRVGRLSPPRLTARLLARLLDVAAVAGAVCIAAVVAAAAFGVSLVMFRTGSMAPAIPAGSLAVVRDVPATDVAVGDVVTVDRPGRLPVTHRVHAIAGTGAATVDGWTVRLTLWGDANPTPDAEPYEVRRVRIVLWSIPEAGRVVARMRQPQALGATTLLVAGLVTWALWPRPARPVRQADAMS